MYYCGVCRSIGKNYGQIPRFGLTNETGMLALILDLVCSTNKDIQTIRKGCIAHPHKKTLSIVNNGCVDYAAAVNVMLIYNKLKDNWVDDKNILARSGTVVIKKAYKKAKKQHGELALILEKELSNLFDLEKIKCSSLDRAAEPFALIMKYIFSKYPGLDEIKFALMGKLGYNIGKWIYLIDALNDIKDDIKKERYNCLLYKYDYTLNENTDSFLERIKEEIRFSLEMCLASISDAWEDLKSSFDDSIETESAVGFIENIFYLGMRQTTDKCLSSGN